MTKIMCGKKQMLVYKTQKEEGNKKSTSKKRESVELVG